jgi:hypothetical protein
LHQGKYVAVVIDGVSANARGKPTDVYNNNLMGIG